MRRRRAFRVLAAGFVALLAVGAVQAGVLGTVEAKGCAAAIGGSVSGAVTVICGIPPENSRPLSKKGPSRSKTWPPLKDKPSPRSRRSSTSTRLRLAALDTLGEKNIPPERLAARFVEIVEQFKELRSSAVPQPGDDAEIIALKSQVQQAIQAGDRRRADDLLARIQEKQDAAQGRLAVERAATRAQRGQVALASLNYAEAAKRFADAARTLPAGDDNAAQRAAYLIQAGGIGKLLATWRRR